LKPTALFDMRTLNPGASARNSLYQKLKPGPGNPDEVIANQIARLRGAMVELVAERGIGRVTVRELASTAGVSTRTFYAHFPNADECFTSTYESVMRNALASFTTPGMTNDDWEVAVRAGIHSLTVEIAEHPPAAALALVEAFEAAPAMLREMADKMHAHSAARPERRTGCGAFAGWPSPTAWRWPARRPSRSSGSSTSSLRVVLGCASARNGSASGRRGCAGWRHAARLLRSSLRKRPPERRSESSRPRFPLFAHPP
jgi:AcrR family transcriptional regulator